MGCFKENEITPEGELLSAAVIIKDILLRLQNQKLYNAMEAASGGQNFMKSEDESSTRFFVFEDFQEACV